MYDDSQNMTIRGNINLFILRKQTSSRELADQPGLLKLISYKHEKFFGKIFPTSERMRMNKLVC